MQDPDYFSMMLQDWLPMIVDIRLFVIAVYGILSAFIGYHSNAYPGVACPYNDIGYDAIVCSSLITLAYVRAIIRQDWLLLIVGIRLFVIDVYGIMIAFIGYHSNAYAGVSCPCNDISNVAIVCSSLITLAYVRAIMLQDWLLLIVGIRLFVIDVQGILSAFSGYHSNACAGVSCPYNDIGNIAIVSMSLITFV